MKLEAEYDGGLSSIAEILGEGIEKVLFAGGERACEMAKEICPVDTGTLRDSISVSVGDNRAEISANTDYASYVEFGTTKMAPQPYLVPSLLGGSDEIVSAMAQVITEGIGR